MTGVSLNKSTTSIAVSANETLTATVTPNNTSYPGVVWSSSNSAVATVDATGKVVGVATGTAVITATTNSGGFTASCTVTVTA